EWHIFPALDGDQLGAAEEMVGERTIDCASLAIVAHEAPGADVERHALAEPPGKRAEQCLGAKELAVERGEVEDVELPPLADECGRSARKAAGVGKDLGWFRAQGLRVGDLDDVDPAQP